MKSLEAPFELSLLPVAEHSRAYAFHVFAFSGIDANHFPFLNEVGNPDNETGFERGRLEDVRRRG
jgi:hypothetical protein